jgi:hypothetical protein
VTIDGEDYHFYTSYFRWSYLTFVKIKKKRKGSLALEKFIAYLINNNYITPDEYLASVELGNEIVEGKGETVVKSFEINVK